MVAKVQITAEQLLREARSKDGHKAGPPKRPITDEELKDIQLRKRKQFEDSIHKNRNLLRNWVKYAQWEESQKEFARARSVYERGIDVDH